MITLLPMPALVSYDLALAIGWEPDQMAMGADKCFVADWPRKDSREEVLNNRNCYPLHALPWRVFDYRDPTVCWPLAKHFNMMPRHYANSEWGFDDFVWRYDSAENALAARIIHIQRVSLMKLQRGRSLKL